MSARAGGESLDDLLPEAFALCREAARRTIGQRHFDVQLIGGMVLHDGSIAEMKTGEGKTLTATLAVFLNSLGGDGVHLVTVNDYLARRDAEWMGPIYEALGVSVGVIQAGDDPPTRQLQVRLRRRLRDQLRVRLRLPARQHGRLARALRPARPRLRDRRRGRQHPHRRGADAADHLRPPEQAADLYYTFARLAKQMKGVPAKEKLKSLGEAKDTTDADYDYEYDEKHKTVAPTERRGREGGEVPRRRQPLPRRARHPRQPPRPVA